MILTSSSELRSLSSSSRYIAVNLDMCPIVSAAGGPNILSISIGASILSGEESLKFVATMRCSELNNVYVSAKKSSMKGENLSGETRTRAMSAS
jgi:hypothetical protein